MSFVAVVTGVVSAGVGVAKMIQGKKASEAAAAEADLTRIEMTSRKLLLNS